MNRVKLQFIFALFWFVSAYLAISAVLPLVWAWRCAWLNLIIGLVALLIVTRTEEGDKLFYKGPEEGQPGSLRIAVLWAIPPAIFCIAIGWWILRLLGFFDFYLK